MSEGRARIWRAALVAGAAALGIGIACLIPDRGILVLSSDFNRSPIRFVEGIPLEPEALCACDPVNCQCPLPELPALPYYLDPEVPTYQFCICEGDRVDTKRLPGVTLYVEDQDEREDGSPRDTLYAAALLDWDPTTGESPFEYIAYRRYLDPQSELELIGSISSYENLIIKRPRPYVREIPFNDESIGAGFDLCNDSGRAIEPGIHTLSVIATDRFWASSGSDGEMTTGVDDEGPGSVVTLEGVPDIAAGATYDIQTYVFNCFAEGDELCGCDDPDA